MEGNVMRIVVAGVLIGGGLLVSAAAWAADDRVNDVSVQTTANLDGPQKIICRYVVHQGILIRRPECHSGHEWEALLKNREREIREFQQRSFTMLPR
jgi:hypothetical protein